jgi:hypothetical protein
LRAITRSSRDMNQVIGHPSTTPLRHAEPRAARGVPSLVRRPGAAPPPDSAPHRSRPSAG